jgi:hypothetical protein
MAVNNSVNQNVGGKERLSNIANMSMTKIPPNQNDLWPLPVRSDRVFTLHINRNIVLTLLLSVLLHLSLLWIFAPKLFSMGAPVADAPPLQITLGPPQKEQITSSEAVVPLPEITQEERPKPTKAQPPRQVKPVSPPIKMVEQSDLDVQKAEELNKAIPQPAQPEVSVTPLPGEDMQAYIKRQQQAKLAKEGLSKQDVEAVIASNNPQSEGAKRDAKIKENLNLDGTNGVFEIRYLGPRAAQFSFKGWKNNVNTARLEVIDVSAPDGVDIKKAVIEKMIEIIRRDYQGDFNWDSHRLGRVIVLSARVEDTQALESFMMHEFFGAGTRVR